MSQQLISRSPDLKRLRDEGMQIEIQGAHLLVYHVPYVNSAKEIKFGTLVSTLNLSGDRTTKPDTHVVYFIGEYPCQKDGSIISAIQHQSTTQKLTENITVNHSFSNKPSNGYDDYYHKMTRYIEIISGPAKSLDDSVTEKTFQAIKSDESDSVFNYLDTSSSRAGICDISAKLKGHKVAIIGLGGTGSYILDLIAKTPVEEIHLFDGDYFLQHNAFRSPGAPSIEIFNEHPKKVEYLKNIYSKMRRNIVIHPDYINPENIVDLTGMNFVFIAIDKGEIKKLIVDYLVSNKIPFIDTGMGIHRADDSLVGIIRLTSSTPTKNDHIEKRISFADAVDDEYSQNIQIADLNALNAALAVIKWKKICNCYQDLEKENNTTYSLNTGQLLNEDNEL